MRNYYSAIILFSFCMAFILFHYYLMMNTLWTFSNTTLIVVVLLFIAIIYILVKEFTHLTRLKKFTTFIINSISIIFTAFILLYLSLNILITTFGGAEHILKSYSPNMHYKLDFYAFDAGAMGTFGIRAELDGPLGFKKQFYYERHGEEANVEWLTNEIVVINGHELNLKNGDTFGYIDPSKGR